MVSSCLVYDGGSYGISEKTQTDTILMIFTRKKCFPVKKYFAGVAGAPARPNTSGDIFAPINLGVDRPVAHFCEIIYRENLRNEQPVERRERPTNGGYRS